MSSDFDDVVQKLRARYGTSFEPSLETDILDLRELSAPEDVIGFVTDFNPTSYCGGLHSCAEMVSMAYHGVPASSAVRYGFFPIAGDDSGDEFYVDRGGAGAPVVRLSHETLGEESSEKEFRDQAEVIAPSFVEFLRMLGAGEV